MSFYSSNNRKFLVYKKSRRKEEIYNEDQQEGLDEILAEKRGEVDMATRYGKLAKSVINAFGQQVQSNNAPGSVSSYLNQLIQNGQLSQAFDKIKAIGLDGLSPEAQDIVKDIKNPEIRKSIVSDFNSKLEKIMIANASDDEKRKIVDIKDAERSVLKQAAKNPSLAEMAAKKARELAEKRDVEALDMIRGMKPKESAFLTELKAKKEEILSKPPNVAIKEAFVDSVAKGKEEALDEILSKHPISPTTTTTTMATTDDMEDEQSEIKIDYRDTTTEQIFQEIKSRNAKTQFYSADKMAELGAIADKPQGNVKGGLSKKLYMSKHLTEMPKT